MAEKKADKCAHPGCNCPAAKDSKYCSEYCGMVTINYLSTKTSRTQAWMETGGEQVEVHSPQARNLLSSRHELVKPISQLECLAARVRS